MAKQTNSKMGNRKPNNKPKPSKGSSSQARPSKGSKVKNFFKKAVKTVAPIAAGFLGDAIGGPVAGSLFSSVASKLTGQGDYRMVTTGAAAAKHDIPSFGNISDSGINIKNREFISVLKSSTSLASVRIEINPGLTGTFPFLSRIAANFEKYRFRGLVFYFKSTAASAFSSSTNIALGQVIMSSIPDPAEDQPGTLEQLLNRKDNSVGKPSEDILHGWECRKGTQILNEYYVRTSATDDDQDVRFTDPGYVLLSTNANPAADMEIGQLWVSYDVDLMIPKLSTSGDGFLIKTDRFYGFSGIAAASPLGTVNSKEASDGGTLGCIINGSADQIVFPSSLSSGTYLFTIFYRQDAGSIKAPSVATYTNCSQVATAYQASSSGFQFGYYVPWNTAVTEDESTATFVIKVTAPNASLTLATDGVFGANVVCTVIITQVNPSAFTSTTSTADDVLALLKKLGLKKKTLAKLQEIAQDKDSCWSFE